MSLDLDDKTGKDQYGRWVAVCYLDGKNFNKQLVDAGQAVVKDFKNNEFDPRKLVELRIDRLNCLMVF